MVLCLLRLVQLGCTAAFKICIKAVEMPTVGMGWQRRWHGRLEVPSPQQATTPGRYWLVRQCNHWEKKMEKRAAKNGRGDGVIERTEEKVGDYIMSPTKDRLIAQLTFSLVPPSLLSFSSPSFLGIIAGKDPYKTPGPVGNSGAA